MIKQYRDYELAKSLRINGDLTLKENIADNGAIKEAYQAYEKYVQKFGEELPLPGLKYSPRQLFWIAAAMVIDPFPLPVSSPKTHTPFSCSLVELVQQIVTRNVQDTPRHRQS